VCSCVRQRADLCAARVQWKLEPHGTLTVTALPVGTSTTALSSAQRTLAAEGVKQLAFRLSSTRTDRAAAAHQGAGVCLCVRVIVHGRKGLLK
jgi:hypothetical protein